MGMTAKDSTASSNAQHGSYRSGFAFGVLSFVAMGTFAVLSTVVLSRIYGVRIIGQFALVSAPVAALWVLSTAKEQAALIKEITGLKPRHPRVTQLFAAVFTFSTGLTIVMSILGMVVSALAFDGPLHNPTLVVPACVNLAGYAIVTNTGWNVDSIFSAFVAGRQLFWVRLHEAISVVAIGAGIGLAWHSVWGLVIGTIGGSLTSLVHRLIVARAFVRMRLSRAEYRIGLRALPGLLRFGLKITPGGIAQGISQQAGIWALAAVGSPLTTIGAYNRAQSIPERLQQVNLRVVEVLYPTLVGRRAKEDGEGFDRALIDSIRYALMGTLLIGSVTGGAAHLALDIFGPGFNRAAPALALLVLYPAMASITVAQNQAFFAVDRPGLTSVIAVVRLLITVVLTIILTPLLGITGPATALLAGYVLQVTWSAWALLPFLSRRLHFTWPLRERLSLIVAYAAGFGVAKGLEHLLPSLAGLPLCLAGGVAAYAAAFCVAGGVNSRDRRRLADAVGLVRARRNSPPTPVAAK
jgi:O-antigen/teichoic acid export membrane protein